MFEVEVTDEFSGWYETLSVATQSQVQEVVSFLEADGPGLGRPLVDTLKGSRHANMKELRRGTVRVLFAFDPRRTAILLIGGDKRDRWNKFYAEAVPAADDLYDIHLTILRSEGLI